VWIARQKVVKMLDVDTTSTGSEQLNRQPAPEFPLGVLGDRWAQWVKDAAGAAACPVDYVAGPLLAAASALIGHARWVQAWEGWREPPHLWCAAIGNSGDGKSSGADAIYRHILPEIERRMTEDLPDALREREEIEAARFKLNSWKNEMRTALKEGRPLPPQPDLVPQEPLSARLMVSDTTIEHLATVLATTAPKGVLLTWDDIAGWLFCRNADNESAHAFWLEAYGGRRYCIYRQGSPELIVIPRFAVSLYGSIQPGRLTEVMRRGADDGLLARFVWFWPGPVPFAPSRQPPATEWAIRPLDRLRKLDLISDEDGLTPRTVPLDTTAAQRMLRFAEIMQEQKETATGLRRSAIGKARGLALRLSLVLEYLRWSGEERFIVPPDKISDDAMLAATRFVSEYAMPMADRLYRCTSTQVTP
jgi:hypothetical protein